MKLHFRIFSFVTVLFLCFATNASASPHPADNNEVLERLHDTFDDAFGYCKIWYYAPTNDMCMDIAIDGLASAVLEMSDARYGSDQKPWTLIKDMALLMNDYVLWMFEGMGRSDLAFSLSIVNDDIYIRNDRSQSNYQAILSVRNSKVWFDLLSELEFLRYFEN